jgi:hypothetical protein
MKTSQILTNFTAGTFSPRLNGRVDISKYFNACRTLENMIVFPHGGASRRFGTVFVAETKASATISRLIPFQFNVEQAYMLEFGQNYLRFFMNNGQIMSGVTPYEISSPYTTALLSALNYAQNADTMRIVNQSVYPYLLTRTGHTAWTLASSVFIAPPADWSAVSGYPSDVALYEQRSVYTGTTTRPQTMWFSSTGNLDDMTSGTASDDGMELTLDDNSVIKWVMAGRFLNVGTGEAEWVVSSGSTDVAMTPTAKKARRISRYGSSSIPAIAVGNALLFVQRTGRKLRELIYDYVQDNFGDPPDLTIFAEHVTKTGIKSYAFQKEPDSILWCVLNDGTIAAFTYNKAQDITGWHTHTTDGLFEDVEVIPVSDHDQVWFIVQRTIGGVAKRYIEYLAPDFGDTQHDCWFVDSGLKYDGTGATTVSGLDHLIGESVNILADGSVKPAQTVTASGTIALSTAASVVIAGLPFTSILEPMDLETKESDGTSQGKRKKIHAATVRFYKTLGAKIGTSTGTLDTIPFRKASDPMDSAPPLFTGDKTIPFPGGWDRHGYIRITQEQPLPLTVLAIIPLVNTND